MRQMKHMNESIQLPYNFTPRSYQLAVFQAMDNGGNRAFLRWARRSGKDVFCWNYMIKKAFERVGNYYYIFPTYSQGKKALWEGKTKDQVKYLDFIPKGLIKGKPNSNEMKIELINGSIIRIIGSDDVDALRGAGPCGIVFSEYAFQRDDVWEIMRPMLLENGGWAIFNSTPAGKNHMYDFEMAITGQPEWYVSEVQALWPDLPNYYELVSQDQLDEERRTGMTEERIEAEYGVSYMAGQKGAYYMDCITSARSQGRIGTYVQNDHKYTDTYLDLGITDDTAIWFRQIDGNRIIWTDYYENNTKDLAHYVGLLKDKQVSGVKFRIHNLPHDGAQHNIQTRFSTKELFVRLLQDAGVKGEVLVASRPPTKQLPINLTRERFSRYHFNEATCADGIKKLSLYHRQWDRNSKAFRDYPAHDWTCHAADAIALEGLTAYANDDYGTTGTPMQIITDFDPIDYGSDDGNYQQ